MVKPIITGSGKDADAVGSKLLPTAEHASPVSAAPARTPANPQLEAFGRRLYALMLAKGWRQSELARRADLPRDSVSTYIRGLVTPTPQSLKKLAQALGTTENDLWPGYPDNNAVVSNAAIVEMSIDPNNPTMGWLRINRLTRVSTALKILSLLRDDDEMASGN